MSEPPPSPAIHVSSHRIAPASPTAPTLVVQVTHLVDSYMLWVGVADEPHVPEEQVIRNGHLARDWACAMPARDSSAAPGGASLFRSSSDIALPMAQRLARRFKKQMYVSVDIPASITTAGADTQIALEMEKALMKTLKGLEQ
ncbi:hypothetical protein EWM64_g9680 [Hericium alpestre]|uniref:Proteasome assembly chaperone 3 n=1 Tax=Hericium alpestre TaxID=135208 RepID=A0A4Y9ZI58_9AGAM|nr:hypothetical protein EWM64_g9680 [Hericium alpestre]